MGQQIQQREAKEAAQQFESGHVCRNCESQLMRLPGGEYHWCATCGLETHGSVDEICMCGTHVGKHNAQMRCATNTGWANQINLIIRRKVAVVTRPQPVLQPVRLRDSKPILFDNI